VRTCPNCGVEVEGQAVRCPACGADLVGRTESFPAIEAEETASFETEICAVTGPTLVVQKGPEVGERFRIDRDTVTVGRDPARDIFLNDITVSRSHAEIVCSKGMATIRDTGSLNGTYVNGARVSEIALAHGDTVQVGRFHMIYLSKGVS